MQGALRERGRQVLVVREPGGSAVGEQIRHILKYSADSRGMTPEAELLLFAASRAQLTREVIRPALDAGMIVISDRFRDSTTVYQGVARRIPGAFVEEVNAFAVAGCEPEVTFLLDMDAAEAMQRARLRPRRADREDRMEQEPIAFYQAVRDGYLALARANPKRIFVLNAAASESVIAAQAWAILEESFHGIPRD